MYLPAIRRRLLSRIRWGYRLLQLISWGFVFTGPVFIFCAINDDYRYGPSLHWPKVSGAVMQCEEVYHRRYRNSFYSVEVTYTYIVNEQHHVGRRIALWSPDLHGKQTGEFVSAHPVHSTVDVYYNPQQPDIAVLIPGPDELGKRIFIWCGSIISILGLWIIFRLRTRRVAMRLARELAKFSKKGATRVRIARTAEDGVAKK